MKFKVKNILLVSFLAIAGFFGVSSTLVNKQVNEQPVVEKAEAANAFTGGSYIMFDIAGISWWTQDGSWAAAYFYGSSGDYWQAMDKNNLSGDVYFCQVPTDKTYDHVIFVRMKSGWSINSHWEAKYYNQTSNLDFTSGTDTYVCTSCGDKSSNGSWVSYDSRYTYQLAYGEGGEWTTTYTVSTTGYKNNSDGLELSCLVTQLTSTAYEFGFKRLRESNDNGWFHSGYINSSCPAVSNGYLQRRDSQNGKVLKEGIYDVYFRVNVGDVYIQDGETIIDSYSSTFLSTVTCDGGTTAPSSSNWTTVSDSYSDLSPAPKYVFKRASISGSSNLNKAVARYDYIIHKYGTSKYSDFADRTNISDGGAYAYSAISSFSSLSLFADDESNISTIIIIAASGVALLSVTTLSILVIKKRKEK